MADRLEAGAKIAELMMKRPTRHDTAIAEALEEALKAPNPIPSALVGRIHDDPEKCRLHGVGAVQTAQKDPGLRGGLRQHFRKLGSSLGMHIKVWVTNASKSKRSAVPKVVAARAARSKSARGRALSASNQRAAAAAATDKRDQHSSDAAGQPRKRKRQDSSNSSDDSDDSGDSGSRSDEDGSLCEIEAFVCAVRHPRRGDAHRSTYVRTKWAGYPHEEDTYEPAQELPGGSSRGGVLALYGQYLSASHGESIPVANLQGLTSYECSCPTCKALPTINGHRSWDTLPNPVGRILQTVWPVPGAGPRSSAGGAAAAAASPWEKDELRHDEIMPNGESRGDNIMERQLRMQSMQDERSIPDELAELMDGGI
jgi:hypothetical protein